MKEKDVLRYLQLLDRRLSILTSGINWKPEYEEALLEIEKELSELRKLVEEEHEKRMK
ncbi:MAG: hypothetical protein HFH41_03920 [Lachnospiraceae bacterium]|nr:hypothetical protein [Lachnospiraceae bacterium]